MMKSIKFRAALMAILLAISAAYLAPTFISELPDWWKKFLPTAKIPLGLDLQGGMHLILDVEVEKALDTILDSAVTDVRDTVKNSEVVTGKIERKGERIEISTIADKTDTKALYQLLKDDFPNLETETGMNTPNLITLKLKDKELGTLKEMAIEQGVETLRNRIDQFGVTEPVIQREGDRHIVVQLPGVKDPQRAMELVGRTAQLEFMLVDDGNKILEEIAKEPPEGIFVSYDNVEDKEGRKVTTPYLWSRSKAKLQKYLEGKIPADNIVYLGETRERSQESNAATYRTYLLKNKVVLKGDMLKDARVRIGGNFNEPYVSIKFNARGGRVFEEVTGEHTGERLAIILDNTVYSAPRIKDRIAGGDAVIEGSFTSEEAGDLSIILRSGAMPAPVKIIQNVTVGPSMGMDSIKKGVMAALVGTAFVVLFMVIYYRMAGLIADLALVLNIIFLLASMSILKATLTLPGIAGIILAIGMAVDSNVLMFERMREEVKIGKTPRASVDAGYDKAFLTILDSHITTLITALVLFQFGTGPIKGFAVSLSLGVTINLFTALVGTKMIFDFINSRYKLEKLSI
jgi:protein-export membrane protein SecD